MGRWGLMRRPPLTFIFYSQIRIGRDQAGGCLMAGGIQLKTATGSPGIAIAKRYNHALQPHQLTMEILVLITVLIQELLSWSLKSD